MIINEGNIEKWFFDYFENELSFLERNELESFVANNPQFQDEFSAWEESYVQTEPTKPPVAYVPEANLFATVPFYATPPFRTISLVSVVFLLSLGGYWIGKEIVLDRETLGKEKYNQRLFSHNDFEKNTVEQDQINHIPIASINTTFSVPPVTSSGNSGAQTKSTSPDDSPKQKWITPIVTTISKRTDNNWTLGHIKPNLIPLLATNTLNTNGLLPMEFNGEPIPKSIKNKRYKFLDFSNNRIEGIVTTKSEKHKKENDKWKEDKATVQPKTKDKDHHQKNKSHHHKKGIFHNLKNMEIGTMNINDPILEIADYHPLSLNPALSGGLGYTRIKSRYRNQWSSSANNSNKMDVAIDTYLSRLKAGLMVKGQILDYEGVFKGIHVSMAYAQKFSLTKASSLSVALEYGIGSYSYTDEASASSNYKELFPGNPLLSTHHLGAIGNGKLSHNLGISSWYNGKHFYGGVNVTNLLRSEAFSYFEIGTSYIEELNYSLQIGTDYKSAKNENWVFSPYAVLNKVGQSTQLWAGSSMRYKSLILGFAGSTNNSGKVFTGLQGNTLRLLYGYDVTPSQTSSTHLGSHEISLRILIGNKNSNWSRGWK